MKGPFFGVKSRMIVHDLNRIRLECSISDIKKTDRKYFTPDTLEQAKKEGYRECEACLRSE